MAVQRIPTMCLNCSTVYGMIAKVEHRRILKLEGYGMAKIYTDYI